MNLSHAMILRQKSERASLPCGNSPSLPIFKDPDRHPDHNDLKFQYGKELQALRPRFLYLPSSHPLRKLSWCHPIASSFLIAL
jgi:hypothetical protein